MAESQVTQIYLLKAEESLAGAESEFINGRYNNTANRCYYACFQAAIAALLREGFQPSGEQWSHEFVPARFVGELINRRHLYSTDLRDALERTYTIRQTADYRDSNVSQTQVARALRRTRLLVEAVQSKGGDIT